MGRMITALLAMSLLAVMGIGRACADAGEGGRIAQRWCADCHLIGSHQQGSVPARPAEFSDGRQKRDERCRTPTLSRASAWYDAGLGTYACRNR
jgi:hypothetical protein